MPKPFSFKLQKVLDYRALLEEKARMVLAQAQARLDEQQRVHNELEQAWLAHHSREREASRDVNELWLWRRYKDGLEIDIATSRDKLAKLESKLQQCRTEAVERSKEKRLLEKLKETQAKRHHEHESLREQKENDEMATIRFKQEDHENPA